MNNNKKITPQENDPAENKKQAFKEGTMDNTGKINDKTALPDSNKNIQHLAEKSTSNKDGKI